MTAPPADRAKEIGLAHPDVGEEELEAIRRVFASGMLTGGPETAAFEVAFAERHRSAEAVAFANGTVALAAMYLALGIGPGDEVVVPSFTFISTATSVLHVGAEPVFADIDPGTFNLDPADVARRLTPATRAIVAVHYGGQPADLAELAELADEAGVPLLEDAAEAHGATYQGRPVGTAGRAGMFSFTPTKNITTGEGGMVTTDDGDLAERLRLLRNHGIGAPADRPVAGYNWRLTEMQAAMGQVQLAKLDRVLERKRAVAARLTDRLDGIDGIRPPVCRPDRDHVFMLYTTLVAGGRRDALRAGLAEAGIESKLYFAPAHLDPVFARRTATPVSLPVTESVAGDALSLPVHAGLSPAEVDRVAEAVAAVLAD